MLWRVEKNVWECHSASVKLITKPLATLEVEDAFSGSPIKVK